MPSYDYLIVGSGLFGATFAYQTRKTGKRCLVIDKRPHLGGNVYCECIEGINVHKYGAHIFHTSNKEVWDFVNSIVPFNRYTNSPIANYKGQLYNHRLKSIQRNNGGGSVRNFLHLLFVACRCASPTTTIISMTNIKVFPLVDITNL